MHRFIKHVPLIFALTFMVCAVVRLSSISPASLSTREYAAYRVASVQSFGALITHLNNTTDSSPLFSCLSFFWIKLHNPNIIFLRLLSALSGLATLILVYMTTRLFLSLIHAVSVFVIMYFSAYHWYYSAAFTYHSIFLFFVCLHTYAFCMLCFASKKQFFQILYVVSGILALHTNFFILFNFLSQFCALHVITQKKRLLSAKKLSALVGFILLLSPIMLYKGFQNFSIPSVQSSLVSHPHIYTLPNVFLRFFFGVWGIGNRINTLSHFVIYGVFLMLIFKGFLHFSVRKKSILIRLDNNPALTVMAVLMSIQIIVPVIFSYLYPIIDDGKSPLIYALYPVYVMLAAGILSFRNVYIRALLFISFIAVNIHSLIY